jgi:type IV fimbrial biogenesis protein FimT
LAKVCGTKLAAQLAMMKSENVKQMFGKKGGFSLVELVAVLAILASVLLIAIPTYNSTVKPTAELKSAARRLFGDIQFARLRAIKDNMRIGLDFSSNPDRYRVFVDTDADSQYDGGEEVIKTVTFSDDYGQVGFDTTCGACAGDGITFTNDAFAMTPAALATAGGTVFLINENNETRSVVVNQTGSVRIEG